jgi:hypothetical protein
MSPGEPSSLTKDSKLSSGLAFAQQQANVCLQPTANNQPPLMDQVRQLLAEQASMLQGDFDDRLKAQTKKQDAVTAFTAKPVLLRLASDIDTQRRQARFNTRCH